jgi:hypothetical protein
MRVSTGVRPMCLRLLALSAVATIAGCGEHPPANVAHGAQHAAPSPAPHAQPAAEDVPGPVRVYAASWCEPCHVLERELTERGIVHESVDIDAHPDLWRAAVAWTDFPAVPLTRVQTGSLVAWVEGVHAERVETMRGVTAPAGPTIWFAHLDGRMNAVLVDEAVGQVEAWSNAGLPARAVDDAIRVVRVRMADWGGPHGAVPITTSELVVSEIDHADGEWTEPLSLSSRGRPPFEWDDQAVDELDSAMMWHGTEHLDRGYLHREFLEAHVRLVPGRAAVQVRITERIGPRSRLAGLEVIERDSRQGNRVPPLRSLAALRALFEMREGQWVDMAKFRSGLASVRDVYLEAGYARLDDDVEVEDHDDTGGGEIGTRLIVTLVRGRLVRVARVEVDAPDIALGAAEIRKRIDIRDGELERPSRLEAARAKLLASGVARHVDISTRAEGDRDVVKFELHSEAEPDGDALARAGSLVR